MKHCSSVFERHETTCLFLALAFLSLFIFVPATYSQPLEVRFVSLTSPARPGSNATITISTAANAKCEISVLYKSGPSKAQGLIPKFSDGQGRVSWTWRVGTRTTPGSWPITVTCSSGGQTGTLNTSFVVR